MKYIFNAGSGKIINITIQLLQISQGDARASSFQRRDLGFREGKKQFGLTCSCSVNGALCHIHIDTVKPGLPKPGQISANQMH